MWQYNYTDELYHYGVLGMKWGIRRERRRAAKELYRKQKDDAFKEYERTVSDIEKSYKRGQNLSGADLDREIAAEKKYRDTVAKAKADYKVARSGKSEKTPATAEEAIQELNSYKKQQRIKGIVKGAAAVGLGALAVGTVAKGMSALPGIIEGVGDIVMFPLNLLTELSMFTI